MDITSLSPALSQADLQMSIGYELLANVKELAEVQADAITELMAAIPGLGENIDISV
ncbi:MAG: putative motility protein [Lachnospiraceae bacterium]|nr:putative motility protein [Lachnospiraceae bacterium]